MNEVSHRIFAAALEAAQRIGFERDSLLSGMAIASRDLKRRGTVDWSAFADLLERVERRSTDERLVQMGRELVRVPALGAMPDLLRFLVSPRLLITTMFRWAGPRDFRHIRGSIEERSPELLEGHVIIPRHYQGSHAFFMVLQGCLEAMPTLVGQEPAHVRCEAESHAAYYEIHLPPSRTLPAQVNRFRQLLLRPGAVMEELAHFQEELRAGWEDSERAREEFVHTLDRLPDGAFVHRGGRLLYANEAFTRALGLSSMDIRRIELGDLSSPSHDPRLIAFLSGNVPSPPPEGGEASLAEFRFTRRDGEDVFMEFASRSDIHFQGTPAVLVVARDITERKVLERLLAEQQRLVALGEMAAAIGHEIRNPVTTVRLLADNLHRLSTREMSRERVISTAEKLVQTSERIIEIVARLGRFSRSSSREETASSNVGRVVGEAVALCLENFRMRRVSIECEPIDPALQVRCRPVELGQVLVNLFSNAIDATEEQDDRWVRVSARQSVDRVEVLVTDSGRGVPPSMRDRIFEPFYTTKSVGRGTGLGLSLSRRLLQEQGGTLQLDEECRNTRFIITLPAG